MHVNELFNIKGKVAVVTGGSVGLGAQMAAALAEAGANVVLSARKVERCEVTAETLRRECGVETMALRCNVGIADDVKNLFEAVLEKFGRIDILVNNAGTNWGGTATEYPLKGWNKVMDVNVTGTFLCCQYAGRSMIQRGGGNRIDRERRFAKPPVREYINFFQILNNKIGDAIILKT